MNKKVKQFDANEALKYLAKKKLVFFIKYINPKYKLLWFHKVICQRIQDVIDGKGKRKLGIYIPPQNGKSTIVSEYLPAFLLGINSDKKVACASYSSSLAQKMNRSVQRIIQSPEYQSLFPNVKIGGGKGHQANSNEFAINGRKGGLKAVGVGSGLTGFTVDIGIIDDPYKGLLEAMSERQRERVWEWYRSVFNARLNNDSIVILCHTRWHTQDLTGKILDSSEKDDWDTLVIPAIREADKTVEEDPRKIGEALWPTFHSKKSILQERADSERRYNAIYQQRPIDVNGELIKADYINYCNDDDLPDYFDRIVQSWDCTFKSADSSDYVVGTIWGVLGNLSYLIGMVRGKYDFVDTIKRIKDMIEQFPNSIVLIENQANGTGIINQLKKEDGIKGIRPVNPLGSKVDRLAAASFIFEAGNIIFPTNDKEWVRTIEKELFSFPLGKNDDICDSISMYVWFQYLQSKCKLFNMSKNVK